MSEPESSELSFHSLSDTSDATSRERHEMEYYKNEMAKSNTMLYVIRVSFAIFVVFGMYLVLSFVYYRAAELAPPPAEQKVVYQHAPRAECASNKSDRPEVQTNFWSLLVTSAAVSETVSNSTFGVDSTVAATKEPLADLGTLPVPLSPPDHLIFCFFNYSSHKREGVKRFQVRYLPASHCTHVVYYSGEEESSFMLRAGDRMNNAEKNGMSALAVLKTHYPEVMFLQSIGESWDDSVKLQAVVRNSYAISTFVHDALKWTVRLKLDGILISWRYPRKTDKLNLNDLVKELKATFVRKQLRVALALPHEQVIRRDGFDVPRLADLADFLLFTMFGNHNLAIPKTTFPVTIEDVRLFPKVIKKELGKRNADKACLILPLYGLSFVLKSTQHRHAGAAVTGSAGALRYTDVLAYNEICAKNWTLVNSDLFSTFAVNGREWVGYHDANNLRNIMRLTKRRHGIRCFSLSDVSHDDFRGRCGPRFPIVRTCYRNLRTVSGDVMSWAD